MAERARIVPAFFSFPNFKDDFLHICLQQHNVSAPNPQAGNFLMSRKSAEK
jgi:hypothetical protein